MRRKLGAIPSPYDSRDYTVAQVTSVKTSFPKAYIRPYPGKVKNQGSIGSCVAHSLAYTREMTEYEQYGTFREFSTGFIYGNRIGTMGEVFGMEGMVPRDALKNLQEYGDVLYDDFPYNDKYPVVKTLIEKDRKGYYAKAQPYKVSTYYRLYTVEDIKTALMDLGYVTVMFPICPSFYKSVNHVIPIPDIANETLKGYHEMTFIGWRDDNTYITLNSWGEDWEDGGYCYIPFNFPFKEAWGITDTIIPHWSEKYYDYLNENGVLIHEKRFNDNVTRGELFAIMARIKGFKEG